MKTSAKLGRPAAFNKKIALDIAMRLFWERGYEGTSMADLSLAMGIHPSSIYAAFGNKQELFALAAKRYADVPAQYMVKALEQPTLRDFILAAFDNTVEFLGSKEHPSSCFTLTGAISCGTDTEPAKALMQKMRLQNEAAIKARLLKARKAGEFPPEENVDDYTRYLSSLLSGLAIQAANGSTRAELKRTAEVAIRHLGLER
ncbi:TetR family transcriptional regulator [Edaphobacter acidisoli]|uniref:TetR family transcriptional regulator n=1 Tax=Edaphobacter acidisoli TaxID=2040573 RepID=A0A916W057_9BACT|nr:TetR/AcrR family transcriptional regulator [Edaphobacter acidisoli]GGA56642.1 TetR family transcriptional regulator [Edaphobacter acidisoli]